MANWQCPEDWSQWSEWLAAGLHGRCRWRLPFLLSAILFASGRRTVSSWLRAGGVSDDYQDYYYFMEGVEGVMEGVRSGSWKGSDPVRGSA
jgi:hypothetical protein